MRILQKVVDDELQAFVGAFVEWAAFHIVIDHFMHDSNIHTSQHASHYLARILQKVVDDELQAFVGAFAEWAASQIVVDNFVHDSNCSTLRVFCRRWSTMSCRRLWVPLWSGLPLRLSLTALCMIQTAHFTTCFTLPFAYFAEGNVDHFVHDSNILTAQHASHYLARILQKVVDDELQAFVGDFVEWAASQIVVDSFVHDSNCSTLRVFCRRWSTMSCRRLWVTLWSGPLS